MAIVNCDRMPLSQPRVDLTSASHSSQAKPVISDSTLETTWLPERSQNKLKRNNKNINFFKRLDPVKSQQHPFEDWQMTINSRNTFEKSVPLN